MLNDVVLKLLGMTAVIQTNMSAPWCLMTHHGLHWPVILNPIVLLVLYYTMATIIRQLFLSETGTDLPEVKVYTAESSSEQIDVEANLQIVECDGDKGNNNCLPVQMYSSPEYTLQSSSAGKIPNTRQNV
eukprot:g42792.t1